MGSAELGHVQRNVCAQFFQLRAQSRPSHCNAFANLFGNLPKLLGEKVSLICPCSNFGSRGATENGWKVQSHQWTFHDIRESSGDFLTRSQFQGITRRPSYFFIVGVRLTDQSLNILFWPCRHRSSVCRAKRAVDLSKYSANRN